MNNKATEKRSLARQKVNAIAATMADSVKALKEPIVDVIEIMADGAMNDGLLKDIPIVGWASKAYNIRETYQLAKLHRNARLFIGALSNDDHAEIARIADRFDDNKAEYSEFIDVTMAVLLETIKPQKVIIIGNLVSALINNKIEGAKFLSLSEIVYSTSWFSLNALSKYMLINPVGWSPRFERNFEPIIESAGLFYRGNLDTGSITPHARQIWEHGFKKAPIEL